MGTDGLRYGKKRRWVEAVAAMGDWPVECILWPFDLNSAGRPHVPDGYKKVLAYRLVMDLVGRPIPPDLQARHTCDEPRCCNPRHILEGTNADNVADMVARGRTCRGSRSGHAILTAGDVLAMRDAVSVDGATTASLARKYGVHRSTAKDAVQGRTWSWLTSDADIDA